MQQKSLGLIEIQGLAAGIEAADAAVKSANVELVGYELTKGGGWTTIKILGDVGAVKAAVDAARIAAGKVSRVVSTRVIARPSMGLTGLIHNTDTVGDQPPEPPTPPTPTDPPEPTKPPADALSVEESAPEAMESPEEAQ
ncbi:BMC domain-containing protein, partial [Intestinimonas sp. RTP31139st1_F5_RTP31139_211217]|uniref:BMC domain-containing protein n=1 Tax=Intestinimonas sp. RTP31139st1_F5_RTP31139_211217 TaxID=3143190 RepID=UPI0032ED22F6